MEKMSLHLKSVVLKNVELNTLTVLVHMLQWLTHILGEVEMNRYAKRYVGDVDLPDEVYPTLKLGTCKKTFVE